MALITFMSDFGTTDHYVATIKAAVASREPNLQVIDISHEIRPFDILHASNVLKHVFREFPKGTVHLVAVDSVKDKPKPIALLHNGYFFVGFDSGLFSLLFEEAPAAIVELEEKPSTFSAKEVLVPAAIQIAKGQELPSNGKPVKKLKKLFGRQLKVTKKEIAGNVVSVDHFGNLITNINKMNFDRMQELNGKGVTYSVRFGRELFKSLHKDFTDVGSGDCFVLFNSYGELQIGINKGNASELLGLNIDAPVIIEFFA
ncbi:MAG: SAM-dependent chlorinase/fluorinase [Ekhidna sp.]|nr:SAM-dependent chlorinase/fluorinase [Ekhidna sp.]